MKKYRSHLHQYQLKFKKGRMVEVCCVCGKSPNRIKKKRYHKIFEKVCL